MASRATDPAAVGAGDDNNKLGAPAAGAPPPTAGALPVAARQARLAEDAYLVLPGQRFFNTHYHTIAAAFILARRALALALVVFAVVKYRAPVGSLPMLMQETDPSVPLEERAMLARGVAVLAFLFAAMVWMQSLPPVEGALVESGREGGGGGGGA